MYTKYSVSSISDLIIISNLIDATWLLVTLLYINYLNQNSN